MQNLPSNTREYLMYGDDDDGKTTKEWKDIIGIFKRNLDKKNEIISFLSKKGGTFQNFDYYENAIEAFIDAIKKIINPISIESIIKKIKTDKNAKLIFNNSDLLIIAVDYEGVKKYGSPFWCITQDEYTFNDYIGIHDYLELENDITDCYQQWIVYFKNKIPFIDEQSVMGLTINKFDLSAAHWEDDKPCDIYAKDLVKSITIDDKLIINTWSLYMEKIDDMFLVFNDNLRMLKMLKNNQLCEILNYIGSDKILFNILKKCLDESGYKITINNTIGGKRFAFDLLEKIEEYNLINYINVKNIDKNLIMEYFEEDSEISHSFALFLIKNKIIDIECIYDNIDNDTYIYLLENLPEVMIHSIEKSIYDSYTYPIILKFITKNKNNLKKYKQNLINMINKIKDKNNLFLTLDKVDDDDIEIACLHKLHNKSSKYIQRRIVEKSKSFNNFN